MSLMSPMLVCMYSCFSNPTRKKVPVFTFRSTLQRWKMIKLIVVYVDSLTWGHSDAKPFDYFEYYGREGASCPY
ncbi:hypothetical protein KY290_005208 [Solanum tuberosum]|uniref:Uncharacterized protein n=1 Tax=Solanum tuberosum TaxID=4113 RepID=A0ABQ7WDG6_SOLTU|nr:hypothetical protein KY284_005312 [Solanum tuberosum]KAH0722555.1 hypothetical protein KY289_005599 [Solanum tuberosum]KAH0751941.1 hypothetical protein KY285_005089 [Solanum tuberosum]KAH0778781.1 hypothetical protein KY290_005208 [Solanum tuberosum]